MFILDVFQVERHPSPVPETLRRDWATLARCRRLFPQAVSILQNYSHGTTLSLSPPELLLSFLNDLCFDSIFHSLLPYWYNIPLLCVFLRKRFAVNHVLPEPGCLLKQSLNSEPVPLKTETNVERQSRKIEMLTSCMPRRIKMLQGSLTLIKCLHIQHSVPEVVFHTIKCGFAVVVFLC